MQVLIALLLLLLTVYSASPCLGDEKRADLGRYLSPLVAKFLPDGRQIQLEQPFVFVEADLDDDVKHGIVSFVTSQWGWLPKDQLEAKLAQSFEPLRRWDVPSGAIVDGASIPHALWSILGGPLSGKYREASVIHDYFCDTKSRPWRQVHQVFYKGMIASGVDEITAQLMYLGVYKYGPRWQYHIVPGFDTVKTIAIPIDRPEFNKQEFDRLAGAVNRGMSVAEISALVDNLEAGGR